MQVDPVRIEEIFGEALTRADAAARVAYLDQACGDDAQLRQRVEALLAAHDDAGNFLNLSGDDQLTVPFVPLSEGPGSKIGRYKLLEQIGEGAFGVVFMAEQEHPVRRRVALKIIKLGMDTKQVVARFEAESQALAMMDHPNIARVLDGGSTDTGRPYFVMELVKGTHITKYCDERNLSIPQRLDLFIQVCQAVQHAHQKGIIHRDLKPSNVMVTLHDGRPVPKIIDFGVAKAIAGRLTEKTMFTNFAQMVGTPLYMSPEQAQMSSIDVDTRSDIYSLGVLLYELLTGTTPFDTEELLAAGFYEMRRIIREDEPPRPSTRISTLGDALTAKAAHRQVDSHRLSQLVEGDLDWIVMKALEKDRTRRYDTASNFAADVLRHLNDQPVEACPPSAAYRFRKFIRRNKVSVLAGSAIVLALLIGLTLAHIGFIQARRQAEIAGTEAAKATSISDLLQQMLQSANPDSAKGADYTVRQMLDDFSAGLGAQLKDQPEVEAAIRATIGNAYRRLGLPDKAEPHLKAALDLRLRVYGPDHVEVARSLLDYGWNFYEREEPREAETWAREALAIHRKVGLQNGATIEILSTLQLCLNAQFRYKEAEEVAQEILVIAHQQPDPQPEVANVLHRLAGATIMQGDPVKAERLARESVALHRKLHGDNNPETAWGLYHLAWALRDQKKFDEAEAYYREALTIFRKQFDDTHGSVSQTLNGLRYVLTAKGDQAGLKRLNAESAIRMSETIARAKYDDLQLRIYRGKLEHDFGDLDKAIAEFSDVLANKSDMVKIWQIRGDCYLRKGEFAKAAEDFTEAIKLKPQEPWSWRERAYAYMMLGNHEKSIADHTQAIELGDLDAEQWLRRGHSYLALGQFDKAEADYTRAIDLNSFFWENWYFRAQLYAELGQRDKAVADLENAVKHCSGDPDQNELAWRLATNADPRLWNPQSTVELAEKAVDAAPQNGAYLHTLGVAQYRASQFQKSIASLQRSMELRNGGDSVDWFFLAMAHWQLADKEEARKWYDKAVEWMDKNQPNNKDLRLFRQEAEELLAGKPAADAKTEKHVRNLFTYCMEDRSNAFQTS